jgi:tungstate transport system ATP-binding protein
VDAPLFEIRGLKHAYRERTVLEIERLAMRSSSIIGLIGPNGSGKSTLLRLLGQVEKPVQGQIFFKGRAVEPFAPETRFQISLLSQEPYLLKRSVYKNVAFGLKMRGDSASLRQQVHEALTMVGFSGDSFVRRPWFALSGGETQRVALAARLALKPEVLLLDEPTASVDAASAQLIKEAALRARREWGATLVIASHDWQWLYEVCEEVLHLFQGRIFGTGRETIVLGPWQAAENRIWGKRLAGDQRLLVPTPPNANAAAVIEVTDVRAQNDRPGKPNEISLNGIVSRLTLERNRSRIIVTVLVDNLPFTFGLSAQEVSDRGIIPGRTVQIFYEIDRIRWI